MMKKSAFQKILRDHKDRLYGYALYFLRDRDEAEDVVQEVCIKLWEKWDSVDRNRRTAWMMRVAHNQCIDVIRRRKMSVNVQTEKKRDMQAAYQVDSKGDGHPEAQLELAETQKVLLSALDTLPEQTKSMMLMHYFQGLKYEEIGEVLNAKLSTVKVAVHRGRKALKEVLSEHYPERVGEN